MRIAKGNPAESGPPYRRRSISAAATLGVLGLGLASRRWGELLPDFAATYLPDALWGAMIYLGIGFLRPRGSIRGVALAAGLFALLIETSQLSRDPRLKALRRTTLGGLVLGHGFSWSDLVCYAVGIGCCAFAEYRLLRSVPAGEPSCPETQVR